MWNFEAEMENGAEFTVEEAKSVKEKLDQNGTMDFRVGIPP